MSRSEPRGRAMRLLLAACITLLSCGGGDYADNGGMSGTGVTEGSITAFGSIFVAGVEWETDGARIEINDAPASASDLRLGMVVRIEGEFAADGLNGRATSVVFDASLGGPIARDPVDTVPDGREKRFEVLGVPVFVDELDTVFAGGATFDGLARDDVVEVSGFADAAGALRATRVERVGRFPDTAGAELRGTVASLFQDPAGGGVFRLADVTIHYSASTRFSRLGEGDLANGTRVAVRGDLRINGEELDADEIELEQRGLGRGNRAQVGLQGLVTDFQSIADLRVAGQRVDASSASIDPPGLVLTDGLLVEVHGRLAGGVLIARTLELEPAVGTPTGTPRVHIEGATAGVDPASRTLEMLGVTVRFNGGTKLQDDRDAVPNFRFRDIQPGDWLEIDGVRTGAAGVRATRIARVPDAEDVWLRGPVTALDRLVPSLEILERPIPLDGVTRYFDAAGEERTEEEFFRVPGDVEEGDVVSVVDVSAADPTVLGEADEVAIEGP